MLGVYLLAQACPNNKFMLCYYYSSRILPSLFVRKIYYVKNQILFTKKTFLVLACAGFRLLLAHACARS